MYEKLIENLREIDVIGFATGGSFGVEVDCGEAADAIEKLQLEADGMRSNWYKSIGTITELRYEIERVKRERDAAIKHGRWKRFEEIGGNIGVSCSACRWKDYQHGKYKSNLYNYCPNCGAKMDAEE